MAFSRCVFRIPKRVHEENHKELIEFADLPKGRKKKKQIYARDGAKFTYALTLVNLKSCISNG